MLSDEDNESAIPDIDESVDTPQDSIEKPSEIDTIQKHVEESLLFLDNERSPVEESENKPDPDLKGNQLEISLPDANESVNLDQDKVMQNVDGDSTHVDNISETQERRLSSELTNKSMGEPHEKLLENVEHSQIEPSTVIPKWESNDDASLSDEQVKSKVKTMADKVECLIGNAVQENTSIETVSFDVSLKKTEQTLEKMDKTIVNPMLTDITESDKNADFLITELSKDPVPKEIETDNPLSESILFETDSDAAMNVSQDESCKTEISDSKNVDLPKDDSPSNSILLETESDAAMNVSQHDISNISEITDSKKLSIDLSEDNPPSDGMQYETESIAAMDVSQEETNCFSDITDSKEDGIAFLENNTSSDSILSKTDTDSHIIHSQEKTSDISVLSDSKNTSNVSHEEYIQSDSLLDEETDADATLNDSQEESSEISNHINEVSKVSNECDPPSDSILNKADLNTFMEDSQEEISDNLEEKNTIEGSNASVEQNCSSDIVLDVTDLNTNNPQDETCDLSKQFDTDNEVSSVLQKDKTSPDGVLNYTDIDAAMDVFQNETSTIPEQVDNKRVNVLKKEHSQLNITDAVPKSCATENSTNQTGDTSRDITTSKDNLVEQKKAHQENDMTSDQLNDSNVKESQSTIELESVCKHSIDDQMEQSAEIQLLIKQEEKAEELNDNIIEESPITIKQEIIWETPIAKTQREGLNKINDQTDTETENASEDSEQCKSTELETNNEIIVLPKADDNVKEKEKINQSIPDKPTQVTSEKELVWEIKSLDYEPVWTNSFDAKLNNVKQGASVNLNVLSPEECQQIKTWLKESGLDKDRPRLIYKVLNSAKWNSGVIKMAPIPTGFEMADIYQIIKNETWPFDKEISTKITNIHIDRHLDKHNNNFSAAYIKWKREDKFLAVKALQIMMEAKNNIFSLKKKPIFKYDNREFIEWDENEKPIRVVKENEQCILKEVPRAEASTLASSQVVSTPVSLPTTSAAIPSPRPPRPPPFVTGEMNIYDRTTFGLSEAFMRYFNISPPIPASVKVKNLDSAQNIDRYHRIFSAAGEIYDIEAPVDQEPMNLTIFYRHPLEAVQACSMFHQQQLDGRIIEVKLSDTVMNKTKFAIPNCTVGPGLGLNGYVMKSIRSTLELRRLKAKTKTELTNLRTQINNVKQKLALATTKLEQTKKWGERRKIQSQKEQERNTSQKQQANIEAVNAISTALASSLQTNVIGMLGIQPNQQGVMLPNQNSPVPVPNVEPQSLNTPKVPVTWTVNQNIATELTKQPENYDYPQNMFAQTNMQTAFQNAVNMQPNVQGFQNPNDLYAYYANMQQTYMQYGYTFDPSLMQGASNLASGISQPGTSYMQPGKPTFDASTTQSKAKTQTKPLNSQAGPSKPSQPQSSVNTQTKSVLPPISNTNKTVYEIQKPAVRFDALPPNVAQKTSVPKVPDIPPPVSIPAVKKAFKMQIPIQPAKVTKPPNINIKITSRPDEPPVILARKRTKEVAKEVPPTLDKMKVERSLINLAGKLPVYDVPTTVKPDEAWINKQIKAMRQNSKSPEKNRSPEKMRKSPERILPKAFELPIPTRRVSRSPDKRRISRSPGSISRSPEKKRICRSPGGRRISRSPERRRFSRSPERRRIGRSPERRRIGRSPERRRFSRSPIRRLSSADKRRSSRSRSPERRRKSPPRPAYDGARSSRDKFYRDSKTSFMREREIANTTVNFNNLPPSVTSDDLKDKMSEIGPVLDSRKFGKGQATVYFKYRSDAETCIQMYNLAKVDGQKISVKWAATDDSDG